MPHGRRVRMEPQDLSSAEAAAAGTRSRPPPHALGPFFVLGVKESQQKEIKSASATSSAIAAFSGVSGYGLAGAGAAAGVREDGDEYKVNEFR